MKPIRSITLHKFLDHILQQSPDWLAVEEPLEIRLEYGPAHHRTVRNLSVTMRTPGSDEDLVAGFLFTEGIVRQPGDLVEVRPLDAPPLGTGNIVLASLHPDLDFEVQKLERHFYTTSSCGVCGKTSIESLKTAQNCVFLPEKDPWAIDPEILYTLPEAQRRAQPTFEATGGLHAAALFSRTGSLLAVREDVGRHNALDKLIGHYFQQAAGPLDDHILLLSGRASFELLQKSAMAGLLFVCAVGAPSSLAVETAEAFGMTLVGFLRDGRFNVYSGVERIRPAGNKGLNPNSND
jgi:FdhD protein